MHVDTVLLDRQFAQFRGSPDWDKLLGDLVFPWWLFLVVLVIGMMVGLCTLMTVIVPLFIAKYLPEAGPEADVLAAYMATPGDGGLIQQMPWSVAAAAVSR